MAATLTEQQFQTTNGNHVAPAHADGADGPETGPREHTVASYAWAAGRISIGFVFLWASLDKTFALGYATGTDRTTGAIDRFDPAAWIHDGSPPPDTSPASPARSRASSNPSPVRPGPTGSS